MKIFKHQLSFIILIFIIIQNLNSFAKQYEIYHLNDSTSQNIIDFGAVFNSLINDTVLKRFYHFDVLPDRRLIISDNNNLNIDSVKNVFFERRQAVFLPKEQIKDRFYIEIVFIKIEMNQIEIKVKIRDEGVQGVFSYINKDGTWQLKKRSVWEN